jgi:hypothetical protein
VMSLSVDAGAFEVIVGLAPDAAENVKGFGTSGIF